MELFPKVGVLALQRSFKELYLRKDLFLFVHAWSAKFQNAEPRETFREQKVDIKNLTKKALQPLTEHLVAINFVLKQYKFITPL